MSRKTRASAVIILSVLSIWIIMVLAVPRVAIDQNPAVYLATRETLEHIAKQQLSSAQDVTIYLDSEDLWKVGSGEHNYYMLDVSGKEDTWIITATPDRAETYTRSILGRFLLLDFSKHQFPTLRINNGSLKVEEVTTQR